MRHAVLMLRVDYRTSSSDFAGEHIRLFAGVSPEHHKKRMTVC